MIAALTADAMQGSDFLAATECMLYPLTGVPYSRIDTKPAQVVGLAATEDCRLGQGQCSAVPGRPGRPGICRPASKTVAAAGHCQGPPPAA